jgi:ribosomal protein S18 acetylase RimI-like enzyme
MLNFRPMSITDYDAVHALFSRTPGITTRDADSPEATARYLARNPGLSLIASREGRVVGCLMCGHDGRRGYLQHLAVAEGWRNQGVGKALVERCLGKLEALGIKKSYVDVLVDNAAGQSFWAHLGWQKRVDFHRFSFIVTGEPNA